VEKKNTGIPKIISNKFLRILLLVCGFLFTFFAILGAILPLLPTTPFLIVAAACFYRSSERFYNLLMYNRYFGHYLRDYTSGKGIPLRVKIAALLFLWISTLVSVFIFIPYLWLKVLVITIAAGVTTHLYLIRTKKSG
jgi:hypothetical protein